MPFKARPDLEEVIASMCLPHVQNVVNEMEREAKRQAPPTKTWITRADPFVRNTHRAVHNKTLPSNLRFKLTAFQYDIEHPGHAPIVELNKGGHQARQAKLAPGYYSWMDAPRDTAPGHAVQVVNCRCVLEFDPEGVAKMVAQHPARLVGADIRGMVYAEGDHVIQAEYGDSYGAGVPDAPATMFMHKAVAMIGARAAAG